MAVSGLRIMMTLQARAASLLFSLLPPTKNKQRLWNFCQHSHVGTHGRNFTAQPQMRLGQIHLGVPLIKRARNGHVQNAHLPNGLEVGFAFRPFVDVPRLIWLNGSPAPSLGPPGYSPTNDFALCSLRRCALLFTRHPSHAHPL